MRMWLHERLVEERDTPGEEHVWRATAFAETIAALKPGFIIVDPSADTADG